MTAKTEATPASGQKRPANTFKPLLPNDKIERCSWIMPNRLQCWRAGEEELSETLEDGTLRKRQLCERHVKLQKALDAGTLKLEEISTPYKEMTTEAPSTPPDFELAPHLVEETDVKQETEAEKDKRTKEATGANVSEQQPAQKAQDKDNIFRKAESFLHREEKNR